MVRIIHSAAAAFLWRFRAPADSRLTKGWCSYGCAHSDTQDETDRTFVCFGKHRSYVRILQLQLFTGFVAQRENVFCTFLRCSIHVFLDLALQVPLCSRERQQQPCEVRDRDRGTQKATQRVKRGSWKRL